MKRLRFFVVLTLLLILVLPKQAYANMAAPEKADIGSSITFSQNEEIAVRSEVLDIVVDGAYADITATYCLQNVTQKAVSTETMFLSPNMQQSDLQVMVDGKEAKVTVNSFALQYDTQIETEDWRYAVLTDGDPGQQRVDSVTFTMDFAPKEAYDVVISYRYRLGGYPEYDFNVKQGIIEYYLTPAAMWKDFEGLTINLLLDEEMPVISESNLEFTKIDTRKYQYRSDTLPGENLRIVIDENWFQNIFSTLRSPYLSLTLMAFFPFFLILLVLVIVLIWWKRRKKRKHSS